MKDKLLLGLVIVAVLGLFVGGLTIGDDKPESAKTDASKGEKAADQAPSLTPAMASDFVGWWLTSALDYNAQSALQSHKQADTWMTADAAQTFGSIFWTPPIAEAVTTGRMVAGFQPTGVQAQAINPDGSIVVAVSGTMIVQSSGQPSTQQFAANFLVRKEKEGLRIAGVEARSGVPGQTIY